MMGSCLLCVSRTTSVSFHVRCLMDLNLSTTNVSNVRLFRSVKVDDPNEEKSIGPFTDLLTSFAAISSHKSKDLRPMKRKTNSSVRLSHWGVVVSRVASNYLRSGNGSCCEGAGPRQSSGWSSSFELSEHVNATVELDVVDIH
eukprot:GHVN01054615.1.p1 GENE.GHVN01054615.1~~GHVN01054615.1.p1  ORF type:complete len:143 (+),score=13.79 GHVN01054615.1:41-469(+)